MRIFSTFSGIGGFEIGIQNAYRSTERRSETDSEADQGQGFLATQGQDISTEERPTGERPANLTDERPLCVGYSEIDKYAIKVYERNFPNVPNYGDITKIIAEELPDFDCLVGGFPCQAFSIAGKRKGFNDTRGTLFFDLARILRAKQPRLFVFENVKGLLSHDNGNTFKTIIATINELGYDCQWQVLNSKNHGVPQNRERVYIVGHLRGTPRPEVFPITGNDREATNVQGQYTNTLTARYEGAQAVGTYIGEGELNAQSVKIPEATKKGYAEATVGQAINLTAPNSKTRRGRVSDIANTLDTGQQQHTLTQEMKIRRLTPRECEALQGFPQDWTKYGEDEHGVRVDISDTQRYKMCGNAVTTNVVQAVFERILNAN